MKIFITGATGFIGSYLVRRLARTKHEMICLVRSSSNTDTLKNLPCRLVYGDVTDPASIRGGMKECDWVVNLANVYSMWLPQKSMFYKINVLGTRNVMECALEAGVSRIVHVSTAAVYGKPAQSPFDETSAPGSHLFSEYARTKAEGEKLAWELHKAKGLPLVVLQPGICLGVGDTKASADYIKLLVRRLLPAAVFSKSVFTWVHVQDVAEAIVRALETEGTVGQKYLIGNHRMSMGAFNEMVCGAAGVSSPKISLPDFMAMALAGVLTVIADGVKMPPLLGMAMDQARTMREGFAFDGNKARKDLGLSTYSGIQSAIKEAVSN